MQLGFAFLEAGSIRLKNLQSILFKNCIDICADYLVWWVLGFGLAFGSNDNGFIGVDKFLTIDFQNDALIYLKFFFQWGFASTSATIISVQLICQYS
jgi:Amt family ammonium transporter